MQVVADPHQLRYTASLFSNGANELRQKAKRLEDIQIGLVQGQNSWKGEGAQGFSTTMEKIQNEIHQKAEILDEAAHILIRFAYQMDNVNQILNQASNLESTLWSFSGDSEAALQERQSISFQVNQLLQEAEWQANAADAQATSALNSLSIPMPDLNLGKGVPKALAQEPWYDRVVDWFKEQGHEFVVAYEKHWTTGNIWYDELNYWTLGIPDQVEKVFHTKPFSLENLEANLDLFISVVPVTKAESVALDGVKVATNVAAKKVGNEITAQEAKSAKDELSDFALSHGVNDLAWSYDDILKFSGGNQELAQHLILSTKEVQEGKSIDELVNMFHLNDNPAPNSLSNYQTRVWYLWQESKIASKLDYSESLEQVARQAFELRNKIRTQARVSMSDRLWANQLMKYESNKTFDQLVEMKEKKYGLSGDDLWRDMIRSSMSSRDSVDSLYKLK